YRAPHGLVEMLDEQRAVRQAGQRVVEGVVHELALDALSLGHVDEDVERRFDRFGVRGIETLPKLQVFLAVAEVKRRSGAGIMRPQVETRAGKALKFRGKLIVAGSRTAEVEAGGHANVGEYAFARRRETDGVQQAETV